MTSDDVMSEILLGLSELEESSPNVTGQAVTQHNDPVVIMADDIEMGGSGEVFTVIVLRDDIRSNEKEEQ